MMRISIPKRWFLYTGKPVVKIRHDFVIGIPTSKNMIFILKQPLDMYTSPALSLYYVLSMFQSGDDEEIEVDSSPTASSQRRSSQGLEGGLPGGAMLPVAMLPPDLEAAGPSHGRHTLSRKPGYLEPCPRLLAPQRSCINERVTWAEDHSQELQPPMVNAEAPSNSSGECGMYGW